MDFILGVLPFARQLLIQKTNVIICSNWKPSLNDVTYRDLPRYVEMAAKYCKILAEAVNEKRLILANNGQKGPTVDFRDLPEGSELLPAPPPFL